MTCWDKQKLKVVISTSSDLHGMLKGVLLVQIKKALEKNVKENESRKHFISINI